MATSSVVVNNSLWRRYCFFANFIVSHNFVKARTFHPLMQFLKNDVFDDFIGCLIV